MRRQRSAGPTSEATGAVRAVANGAHERRPPARAVRQLHQLLRWWAGGVEGGRGDPRLFKSRLTRIHVLESLLFYFLWLKLSCALCSSRVAFRFFRCFFPRVPCVFILFFAILPDTSEVYKCMFFFRALLYKFSIGTAKLRTNFAAKQACELTSLSSCACLPVL